NIAGEAQRRIGQRRVFDFGEKIRDFDFDVLFRQDVLSERASFFRDFIQQVRVDVVPDAEAKDARVAATDLLHVANDLILVGDADGRQAIGQKNDDKRTIPRGARASEASVNFRFWRQGLLAFAAGRPQRQRLAQRVVNR